MAITSDDLKEFFESIGIALPDAMIDCIVAKVNSVEQCMIDAGYTDCDIQLALLLAGALIGLSMGARKVSSQSAGKVSQSYKYDTLSDLQSIMQNNLNFLDPNRCTDSVVPTKVNTAFLFTTTGGCCG